MSGTAETAIDIRPFQVEIPKEELAELRRRIAAARWPSRELVTDRSQGCAAGDAACSAWASSTSPARRSASRLYWEYKGGFFNAKGVSISVAVTVFPGEQYQAPRTWAEQAYPNLIYFNDVDRGGHFAAWEQLELFSAELRAAFRSLRTNGGSS
jgi:hypothetical protein